MLKRLKTYRVVLFGLVWIMLFVMQIAEFINTGILLSITTLIYLFLPLAMLVFDELDWKIPAVVAAIIMAIVCYFNYHTVQSISCLILILFIYFQQRIKAWVWILAYAVIRLGATFGEFGFITLPFELILNVGVRNIYGMNDTVMYEALLYYVFLAKHTFLGGKIKISSMKIGAVVKKTNRSETGYTYLDEYKKNMKK